MKAYYVSVMHFLLIVETSLLCNQVLPYGRLRFNARIVRSHLNEKNELKVHMKAKHENVSFAFSKCKKKIAYKTNAKRHDAKCNGEDQNSSSEPQSLNI